MAEIRHISLDIRGFLMNHTADRDYRGIFRYDDGKLMSGHEAKFELLRQLSLGRKVIPAVGCNNFDYETGCKGHQVQDLKT